MGTLYLWVFGSFVAGLVLAAAWWAVWGRRDALPRGAVSSVTAVAGLLVLLGVLVTRLMGAPMLLPFDLSGPVVDWYRDYRFAALLLLGIVGSALLVLPVRRRGGGGAADLTRRSPLTFARPRWFVAPGIVLSCVLALTIVAGAASEPDETTGRSTMYVVDLGGERSMGTSIYGWFYSVPALVCIVVLVAVTLAGMALVARPALRDDRELDVHVRSIRTRTIVVAATGTLVLHLSQILGSLAGTASARSGFATSEGHVWFWTSFSALEPALTAASVLCAASGVALWGTVALSGITARRHVPAAPGALVGSSR